MGIKTKEDFKKACKEYDAAQYFHASSIDKDEIEKSGKRVSELEKAFENCPFDMDEDGNIFNTH